RDDRGIERGRPPRHQRLHRARPLEDLREVAALVADPGPVDVGGLAWRDALDAGVLRGIERVQLPFGLAMPDVDRAAARAARTHRRSRLQVPHARAMDERPRQERADRTQVGDVVGIAIALEAAVLSGSYQR